MTLQDKVNIVYNRVHLDTLKNKKYPLTDRIYCKRYSVPLRDDRATKRILRHLLKLRIVGILKISMIFVTAVVWMTVESTETARRV